MYRYPSRLQPYALASDHVLCHINRTKAKPSTGISVTIQNQILLEEMQALVFHKQFVGFIWPICEENGNRATQQQHAWSIR